LNPPGVLLGNFAPSSVPPLLAPSPRLLQRAVGSPGHVLLLASCGKFLKVYFLSIFLI